MTATDSPYIVVLDDDPIVHKMIGKAIGMEAKPFATPKGLAGQLAELEPVAVFVDIHLAPGESGLDALPFLRGHWPFCPIIVVTSDTADDAIGQALAAGANDFIRKPINKSEVVARVKARLGEMERYRGEEQLQVGPVTYNRRLRTLTVSKATRHLSPKEGLLFESLALAKGMLMARKELKQRVWGDTKVTDNAFDKLLHKVRGVLKDLTSEVRVASVYGGGVALKAGPATDDEEHLELS